ncbi:MAG TPA: response regulator transcription factor [Thermoanaerobaculia bacterium]|nr:response regulator transcription factor [Thermoanaerobaculia bacterium]
MNDVRVLLIAHSTLFADALTRSLESAGISVTVEPDSGATVALVEARGTVGETAAHLRRIQLTTTLPLVLVGAEANETELLELVEAGCCGCVARDAALRDLLDAIQNVCCGRVECSPYLAALVSARIRELSHDLTGDEKTPALTPREAEVLRLAARGMSNKEIAADLRIWLQTVKSHLHNVYTRLGVRTRRAAVAKALRLGLIREP